MKHISKKFLIFFIFMAAQNANGKLNQDLENYYLSIYKNEKENFNECVQSEGLKGANKINTACEISQLLSDASFILYDKKFVQKSSLLSKFTDYKPIKKQNPIYPTQMQNRGKMGYVIVEYDILTNGTTTNHSVFKSMCGDPTNPKTKYVSCRFFDSSAIQAARKLEYKPTTYNQSPIIFKKAKHRFTYIMAPPMEEVVRGGSAYQELLSKISDNDLEKSLSIANKNLNKDPLFVYQKARIACIQDRHADCIDLLGDFDNRILKKDKQVSEIIHVTSFSMLVYALFNLNRFDEIIDLEEFYLPYSLEQKNYKNILAITNLYIAAAYINTGNLQKGVYYMALASKNTTLDSEKEFIDLFIEKISSYL